MFKQAEPKKESDNGRQVEKKNNLSSGSKSTKLTCDFGLLHNFSGICFIYKYEGNTYHVTSYYGSHTMPGTSLQIPFLSTVQTYYEVTTNVTVL
jgi:hypothetical protein